jgi:hypothetical protein
VTTVLEHTITGVLTDSGGDPSIGSNVLSDLSVLGPAIPLVDELTGGEREPAPHGLIVSNLAAPVKYSGRDD